jgi:hypothetical protein
MPIFKTQERERAAQRFANGVVRAGGVPSKGFYAVEHKSAKDPFGPSSTAGEFTILTAIGPIECQLHITPRSANLFVCVLEARDEGGRQTRRFPWVAGGGRPYSETNGKNNDHALPEKGEYLHAMISDFLDTLAAIKPKPVEAPKIARLRFPQSKITSGIVPGQPYTYKQPRGVAL